MSVEQRIITFYVSTVMIDVGMPGLLSSGGDGTRASGQGTKGWKGSNPQSKRICGILGPSNGCPMEIPK